MYALKKLHCLLLCFLLFSLLLTIFIPSPSLTCPHPTSLTLPFSLPLHHQRMCIAQQCSKLPAPDNGAVVIANDVATYSCNAGFTLVGVSTRQCQSGGVWSDTPPTCGSVDCGEVQAINNGKFLYSRGTAVSSVATYSCNPGYTLVGTAARTCQPNGMWSASAPVCQGQCWCSWNSFGS